jgi:hypothetical protein
VHRSLRHVFLVIGLGDRNSQQIAHYLPGTFAAV